MGQNGAVGTFLSNDDVKQSLNSGNPYFGWKWLCHATNKAGEKKGICATAVMMIKHSVKRGNPNFCWKWLSHITLLAYTLKNWFFSLAFTTFLTTTLWNSPLLKKVWRRGCHLITLRNKVLKINSKCLKGNFTKVEWNLKMNECLTS